MATINYPELQTKVQKYYEWLDNILTSIDTSQTTAGEIVVKYLDNTTLTFTDQTVQTIYDMKQQLQVLADSLSANSCSFSTIDPNFSNPVDWKLTGSGNMSITTITSQDYTDLGTLTGVDFTLYQGLTNKLVLSGLPASNTKEASDLTYLPKSYVPGSFNIFGFVKINNTNWQLLTDTDLIPTNKNLERYQLYVGHLSSLELIQPALTMKSFYNGRL